MGRRKPKDGTSTVAAGVAGTESMIGGWVINTPMPERPRRLMDLVDGAPLLNALLENGRKTVRHHISEEIVGKGLQARVDEIIGRRRGR